MPKSSNQRQQIIDAALHLFAVRGYASTPISLIAEQAKVSQGLMYNFFISKEDLLREVIYQGFKDIEESLKPYSDKSLPPHAAIEMHVNKTFEIIREKNEYWRLLHTIRLQEKAARPMKQIFSEMVEHVTKIFSEVFKSLGFKHPNLEAILFLSQIDGLAMLYLQDRTIPIDKLSRQIIQRYKK